MSSALNPLSAIDRSCSPVFGGRRDRSASAKRSQTQELTFKYVKNEEATAENTRPAQKPNNVSMVDYQQALENSRYDLKVIANCEVDRANRKVDRAAKQRPLESKKMRQTYNVLD